MCVISVQSYQPNLGFKVLGSLVLGIEVSSDFSCLTCVQVTRLIPNANGTTCNQRIEKLEGTQYSRILRVPFRNEDGILHNWISRFDVYPFLENFVQVTKMPTIS